MPKRKSADLDTVIRLRASTEDRDRWQAKAERAGVSMSNLIRQSLDEIPVSKRRRIDVDPAFIRQIAMLGNNLNQIAHWHNAKHGKGIESIVVLSRLVEIDRQMRKLRESIEGRSHDD